ncbi:hypothetical protein HDU86_007657 [Geranomyces michiganensis]|nr:hypothetical protein HDU86_007657 [Geranomyces michiganensis]
MSDLYNAHIGDKNFESALSHFFNEDEFNFVERAIPQKGDRTPGFDYEADQSHQGVTIYNMLGQLLNGRNNMHIAFKDINNYKADSAITSVVNGKGFPAGTSKAALSRPLAEAALAYLQDIGPKMENSAYNFQQLMHAIADRIVTHAGLRQALGPDADAKLAAVAKQLRDNAQVALDWYSVGGGYAQRLKELVDEAGDTPAPESLQGQIEAFDSILADLDGAALYGERAAAAAKATATKSKAGGKRKATKSKKSEAASKKAKADHAKDCTGPSARGLLALFRRAGPRCTPEGNYLNDKGEVTDKFGNRIDTHGFARDPNGNYVTIDGRPIDGNGNLLDKSGHPIDENGRLIEIDPSEPTLSEEDMADIRDGEAPEKDEGPGDCIGYSCFRLAAELGDKEANQELDWGETVGGTEELEGLISLSDSEFFAETEIVNGRVVIKPKPTRPRLKILPRAQRKDGKIQRTQGSKSKEADLTESSAGKDVPNAPDGVPYEGYYGDKVPYEGILDDDMTMDRYVQVPTRFGFKINDHIGQTDLHSIVQVAINERFGEVASGKSPLTLEQAKGFLDFLEHTQKSIAAKRNRITRMPSRGAVQQLAGRGSEATTNFAIENVNSLQDTFNTVRGAGDANVKLASQVAGCGANCVNLGAQTTDRLAISRGAAKKISPNKLRALVSIKELAAKGVFATSFSAVKAPPTGDWLARDILANGGFTEEAMDSLWSEVGAALSDTISKPGFKQQPAFEAAMSEWAAALDSEQLTFENLGEQVSSVAEFNKLAGKARQRPRSLARAKTGGCSSKTTACSRAKATNVDKKLLDVLQIAKELDTTGKMFSEGVYPNSPPDDGWIASDIVDGAGDGDGNMENIMSAVADVVIESASSDATTETLVSVQAFMNSFSSYLRGQSVTSANVHEHLNGVRAYNKVQRALARRAQTNPDPSRPEVQPLPSAVVGPITEKLDPEADMADLVGFVTEARGLLGDSRIGNGDLTGQTIDPNDIFQGAATIEEAIDGLGTVVASAAISAGVATNPEAMDPSLKGRWKRLINRKALGIAARPSEARSLDEVANYESHLNSFNAGVHPSERLINTADLRPQDHIQSVLTMDTFDLAKTLTLSDKIFPAGEPIYNDAGEVLPNSLYAGATTESEALQGIVDETLFFVESQPLTTRAKLQVKRISSNMNKRAQVRQGDLESAVAEQTDIGQDDVAKYNDDVALSNRMAGAKVDLSEIADWDVQDGFASDANGVADTFPSFSSTPAETMRAKSFAGYQHTVAGSRRTGVARRFAGTKRTTLLGRPRASLGTSKRGL